MSPFAPAQAAVLALGLLRTIAFGAPAPASAPRDDPSAVERERRLGRKGNEAVGGGARGAEIVAAQVNGDEVRGGRRETRVAMERLFEQRRGGVEMAEMDLRQRKVVPRGRSLRLRRVEDDQAPELGR